MASYFTVTNDASPGQGVCLLTQCVCDESPLKAAVDDWEVPELLEPSGSASDSRAPHSEVGSCDQIVRALAMGVELSRLAVKGGTTLTDCDAKSSNRMKFEFVRLILRCSVLMYRIARNSFPTEHFPRRGKSGSSVEGSPKWVSSSSRG